MAVVDEIRRMQREWYPTRWSVWSLLTTEKAAGEYPTNKLIKAQGYDLGPSGSITFWIYDGALDKTIPFYSLASGEWISCEWAGYDKDQPWPPVAAKLKSEILEENR